ncbi:MULTISPECIES: flagellin [unclassified Afipia]|uniref:flagellin N-terminal helical domain-containing protein n=2 Tax=Afipia TaxID=1033 RepID=UPI0003F52A44|nr:MULTISPECIES: flagellin [unclassified Afipia]
MSDIVLSASVRQNLLSLQSTADLLATTQTRLATGKKVNTALDNPTNFFTAAGLDARASDINNLLDGIGNGVQVLQAANTGITSLQKLIDTAKSIANQALQTQVGYTKSVVTTAPTAGANGANILGTSTPATAGTVNAGAFTPVNVSGTGSAAVPATAATTFTGAGFSALDVTTGAVSFTLNVDGASQAVTIDAAAVTAFTGGGGTLTGTASALTAQDVAKIIDFQVNGSTTGLSPVAVSGGQLQIASATTGATSQVTISGYTSTAAGGSTGLANTTSTGTALVPAVPADSLAFSVTVDGGAPSPVTISAATVATYNTANGTTLNAASLSAANIASIINYQVGSTVASVTGGNLVFTSGTTGAASTVATSAVTATGAATNTTGIAANSGTGAASSGGLNGTTLTITSTGGGTPTNITFGTGVGQVSTINQLNAALLSNNLQASIATNGAITITTANDAASSTIGTLGGTATNPGGVFAGLSIAAPILDPTSQATRANLVSQYNNIINQIKTTSQDASFNGVNLLNGDQLKLIFNETGKSTLNITGINLDPAGLGLGALTPGTDFIDNVATNKVLDSLNYASSFLRSQASTLGSNLSIVQIRQDFSKNLINVLQTGSTNLTIADTNEEAANSQALSTRQSIAVSALALANQSQQSVLQLLRT